MKRIEVEYENVLCCDECNSTAYATCECPVCGSGFRLWGGTECVTSDVETCENCRTDFIVFLEGGRLIFQWGAK